MRGSTFYITSASDNFRIENRVQWIRQRAARDRYKEEVELLEEELRRLIRGFAKLRDVWATLSAQELAKASPSRSAFAARKQKLYLLAHQKALAIAVDMKLTSVP